MWSVHRDVEAAVGTCFALMRVHMPPRFDVCRIQGRGIGPSGKARLAVRFDGRTYDGRHFSVMCGSEFEEIVADPAGAARKAIEDAVEAANDFLADED